MTFLRELLPQPRVIDANPRSSRGTPWDVSCPPGSQAWPPNALQAVQSLPLVEAAEASGGFINVRWSDGALVAVVEGLRSAADGLPLLTGSRSLRRCMDFAWMAQREHAAVEGAWDIPPELRDLAVRLEWFTAARQPLVGTMRPEVCQRLIEDVRNRVDFLYETLPLLRGRPAVVHARRRVLEAAAVAIRMSAAPMATR